MAGNRNRAGTRLRVHARKRSGGGVGIQLTQVSGDNGAGVRGRATDPRAHTANPPAAPPRLVFSRPVSAVFRNPQLEARLRRGSLNGKRIGDYLLDLGIIAPEVLAAALAEQVKTGGLLGEILLGRGEIEATSLPLALAHQHDLPSFVPEYQATAALPRATAYGNRVAVLVGPAGGTNGRTTLVAATDLRSVARVSVGLGVAVAPRLVDSRTMDRLLADAYAEADGSAANAALRAAGRRQLRSLGLTGAAVSATAWRRRPASGVVISRVTVSGALDAPPEHSLLITLSQETAGSLARLHYDLGRIDYPRHRLQALAVYDPADRATRRALRVSALPTWVTGLAAPHNLARGRRALALYALRQARGETVTVAQAQTKLDARTPYIPTEGRGHIRERFLRQADSRPIRPKSASFNTAQLLEAFDWAGDAACASGQGPL